MAIKGLPSNPYEKGITPPLGGPAFMQAQQVSQPQAIRGGFDQSFLASIDKFNQKNPFATQPLQLAAAATTNQSAQSGLNPFLASSAVDNKPLGAQNALNGTDGGKFFMHA